MTVVDLHDLCEIFIEPGETKYGLQNDGSFTIVSCACDRDFYDCLNSVNTYSSLAVRTAYSLTYPKCMIRNPRFLCQSPANDYDKNPCKGYRSSENLCSISDTCMIYEVNDEFTFTDSHFNYINKNSTNKSNLQQSDEITRNQLFCNLSIVHSNC